MAKNSKEQCCCCTYTTQECEVESPQYDDPQKEEDDCPEVYKDLGVCIQKSLCAIGKQKKKTVAKNPCIVEDPCATKQVAKNPCVVEDPCATKQVAKDPCAMRKNPCERRQMARAPACADPCATKQVAREPVAPKQVCKEQCTQCKCTMQEREVECEQKDPCAKKQVCKEQCTQCQCTVQEREVECAVEEKSGCEELYLALGESLKQCLCEAALKKKK